jgi:hypothetical protein
MLHASRSDEPFSPFSWSIKYQYFSSQKPIIWAKNIPTFSVMKFTSSDPNVLLNVFLCINKGLRGSRMNLVVNGWSGCDVKSALAPLHNVHGGGVRTACVFPPVIKQCCPLGLFQWVSDPSSGVKRPGREARRWPPFIWNISMWSAFKHMVRRTGQITRAVHNGANFYSEWSLRLYRLSVCGN